MRGLFKHKGHKFFTPEQCLGDELMRSLGEKKLIDVVGKVNSAARHLAYSYNDGIAYHSK